MAAPPPEHPPGAQQRRLGAGMLAIAWIGVIALLTAYFSGWLEGEVNPNAQVEGTVLEGGAREVVLRRNRHGHYVAPGEINGHRVRFLVDTGATTVSVPEPVASRLGLPRGARVPVQTANGFVNVWQTRLEEVRVGTIVVRDVRAHINPGFPGEDVLLGMSFLRAIEFSQRGDTLTLHQSAGG